MKWLESKTTLPLTLFPCFEFKKNLTMEIQNQFRMTQSDVFANGYDEQHWQLFLASGAAVTSRSAPFVSAFKGHTCNSWSGKQVHRGFSVIGGYKWWWIIMFSIHSQCLPFKGKMYVELALHVVFRELLHYFLDSQLQLRAVQ